LSSPPDISKESEGNNQSMNDLPDVNSQGGFEDNNQTGNGSAGDALGSETVIESSNETDNGVPDDGESSEDTNQTVDTDETQTNNQDVNVQNNMQKQRLDLIISDDRRSPHQFL
jgi:hypothetical protein